MARVSDLECAEQMSGIRHDPRVLAPPRLVEVGDGVYAYLQDDGSWWINNTGFLIGRDAVVAVDSCSTERRTRALLDTIATVSPLPVRTLVNTHHHGDHTHGNYLFGRATVIGHERCRDEIIAAGPPDARHAAVWEPPDWGAIVLAPPVVTFRDRVSVWVDDLECQVIHPGTPAHTTNDCVVWIPERSVLFSGDLLFNGGTPFLLMGSVAGALDAVAALPAFGATTIVPGHGPICGPETVTSTLDYLRFLDDLARRGHAAGRSPLELARHADLGPFAELSDSERLVGNLHRAYAELDGAPRGAPIDTAAALADMVTYNGGRRLSCLA
jgi:cyclase